ncbi:MAG: alpha/beta hydrolase domain-containing protein [Chloroflexi bacterium]|nr:alpha/beta hydrolase domain-containing protein [Chloroflexota bacterium]MDA1219794.1 alpha/beta hydrolase domain-containing protein [Chloroflexota bacterium]
MAVSRLEIKVRQPHANGQAFGEVGAYEQLDGTIHFAVDPKHPDNALIADIDLAPKDANGLVNFSADFRILRPAEPSKGSQTLFLDVLNRGRGRAPKLLNDAPDADPAAPQSPGNGFLMRQGYTLVWCGWQHDVPNTPGLLGIQVPQAVNADGPISGKIAISFQPNELTQVQMLSERGHQPYPSNHLEDWDSTLTVRDHEEAEPEAIPREHWHFARLENGKRVPDAAHICYEPGFQPGKIYQVIYSSSQAPIAGLGLLGTRDLVSFLRYGNAESGNPCAGEIQYALGFGQSQSGRFLRHLLYLGLNQDETGRTIFDGIIAHVAGPRRGEFNQRFAQPSVAVKSSMSNLLPFTDTPQTYPETGQTDSLLSRQSQKGSVPKIFLMNSGAEYWWAHLSLIHTNLTGTRDLAPSESVRIYYYAGTQHASGVFPLTDIESGNGSRGQQFFNWVDYRPVLRASLANLDRWVRTGATPPPSRHPRLDDGTLTALENIQAAFKAIPGVNFPKYMKRLSHLEFDPAKSPAENLPSKIGSPYPVLVPVVDSDGNELGGIRLPDIAVPLGTHMGWNLRHPDTGAPDQVIGTTGSTIPFKTTREEREVSGDPRLSIDERYTDRNSYLEQVKAVAQSLLSDGFLLAEDLDNLVEQASARYNLLGSTVPQPQPADN